jgi:hypothetical protein
MTTCSSTISILVISDFHACLKPRATQKAAPSYFIVGPTRGEFDAPNDLIRQLETQKTKADVVVCCGDIIDKTDVRALNDAWSFAHRIRTIVGATQLLISTGNHDVDSKGKTKGYSPFEKLKCLKPQYPSQDEAEYTLYWARNYFIRTEQKARYVVLNTCSSHGYKKGEKHGIFSPDTEHLLGVLKSDTPRALNICVCHHHPHRHGEHGLGDHDDMVNAQALLDALSRFDCGQWLIIHGHKHHARITYAQGNSFSPIVFSSGSLSARLYPQLEQHARNQYHLIKIDLEEIAKYKRLVGLYRSWSWFPGTGWREAGNAEGLPHQGGFGYRDVAGLTDRIRHNLPTGKHFWNDILTNFAEIKYLIPSDFEYFLHILQSEGIQAEYDESLGKKRIISLIREN